MIAHLLVDELEKLRSRNTGETRVDIVKMLGILRSSLKFSCGD